jgi:competence protein ComEA
MKENAVNRIRSCIEDLISDRKRLIRVMLIILMILAALILRMHENSRNDITINDSEASSSSGQICVDIGGAVVKPGVYTVVPDTRLFEVIEMAGGLLSNADTDSINRAEYVEDGEKIIIPSRAYTGQPAEGYTEEGSQDEGDDPEGHEDSSVSSSGLVNINTASKEELKTLSGIGDVKADKIIEYRKSGRFRSKEDIKKVEGIGEATYNSIKDLITV